MKAWKIVALVLVIFLVAGIGYAIREGFRYQYFKTGAAQFRTDRWTKETDRLTGTGWRVVQIDRPTDKIEDPQIDAIQWNYEGLFIHTNDRLCATVSNPRGQVIQDVLIQVYIREDSTQFVKGESEEFVQLSGELIMPGDSVELCGPIKTLKLPSDKKWNAVFLGVRGWKR